jgi:hypothetical protein
MLDAFDLQIGANRHLTRAVFGRSLPPLLPGSGSGEHSHRSGYLPIHHCPPPPTLGFPLAHTPAPSAPPHPYRDDESIRRCVSERRGRSIRRTTHDTGLAAHPPDVARPVHASAIQLIRPVPVGSRARDARRRGAGQCGGIGQGREMAISINRSKASPDRRQTRTRSGRADQPRFNARPQCCSADHPCRSLPDIAVGAGERPPTLVSSIQGHRHHPCRHIQRGRTPTFCSIPNLDGVGPGWTKRTRTITSPRARVSSLPADKTAMRQP